MLSILMGGAWAVCWLLSWSKGRGGAKVWEVFEGDSVYGSVAGQLDQAAIWFPSPWRPEDLLQAWQRLPWCASAVVPFQLDSDICWTILKQCGSGQFVLWDGRSGWRPAVKPRLKVWKEHTLICSPITFSPNPFPVSSLFFLLLKCNVLFFFSPSPCPPHCLAVCSLYSGFPHSAVFGGILNPSGKPV